MSNSAPRSVYDLWSFSWVFYRRPSQKFKSTEKIDYQTCVEGCSPTFTAAGIPDSLSLERILRGETRSPCSLADLLSYLRYIEHSPEHLEFWLWHDEYTKKFEALSDEEKSLSPVWDGTAKPTANYKFSGSAVSTLRSNSTVSRGSSFDEKPPLLSNDYQSQPFRGEISKIINRYIISGGARELNISSRDRETALQALSYTTHPSAVAALKVDCDNYLRHQYHPNFIRWVIANCTTPRVNFAYALGGGCLLLGIIVSLLFTLSSQHRAWRLWGALFWFIGAVILICAWKGVCLVLMALGHRRLLEPWEMQSDDVENDKGSMSSTSFDDDVIPDSWDDAPWMQREKRKSWWHQVFGPTVPVDDSRVVRIQDIILVQGLCLTLLLTIPFVAIFLSIPPANLF